MEHSTMTRTRTRAVSVDGGRLALSSCSSSFQRCGGAAATGSLVFLGLLVLSWNGMSAVDAFSTISSSSTTTRTRPTRTRTTTSQPLSKQQSTVAFSRRPLSSRVRTILHMSDVPQKEQDRAKANTKQQRPNTRTTTTTPSSSLPSSSPASSWLDSDWIRDTFKPPPAPEDTFVMMGDLLSLCVYGITDHFFVQVVSRNMVRQTMEDPLHHLTAAAASQATPNLAVDTTTASSTATDHFLAAPVWLDLQSPYSNHILEVSLSNQLVNQYSPLLDSMGTATCLLMACWLLSGWFHHAFAYRNTLDCSTGKALWVTFRTWLTTCALLVGLIFWSQSFVLLDGGSSTTMMMTGDVSSIYFLQRGDLDYVVDSASVLLLWRFLAAWLLGSGTDDE